VKRIYSIFLLSALSLASTAMAATVFTDGLVAGPANAYGVTTAGNFTATVGSVDILQSSTYYTYLCAGATTCIDLNGSSQGTISSGDLTLTPGQYELTFTLNNAQRKTLASTTVSLGGFVNQTYTDPAPGLVTADFFVASTSTVDLVFASNIAGGIGDILSGVSLNQFRNGDEVIIGSSAVPEPSSAFLLSLPLLGFGAMALKRAQSRT
jgi:hypothetical protein